ncbi:hypothetical protein LCGC14_2598330 [marine sediment metagenome]|uniref:Uncharacterized protein n=1 Tax=marine sediment metagenome TaxID=412755 RepID=A0A0F9AXE7_9ZZZZ
MGAIKSKLPGVDKINGKRGSTKNKNRLEAFSKATSGSGADWSSVDAAKLRTVVSLITALGGAVTFGMSRNNGAYSITLMLDDHRETLWFNGSADMDEELEGVAMTLDMMP